ncbi:MAG TPA: lysylphosphatidylglycerol synthase transmembrane domain-containing protein [Thermodesulfobacteriota bacterium]|nr:flippase-like domain-containing protein [Deltaproteobacteria bacterium]HNR11838.1 lysylphosphatidylglycerol synthase transmembrane domain-containing protein [Thermodesulfobacteriota bacterium]HNU70107.1 lysylphosphatidylglycerol synthase transmembrane domain-containing protein [Thermodesulfobacteriota bacterium]HQO77007.1 lysylphosphatidylglycerol synthase transmembrane domain-containing protein [Thermodesulfobacteriota bacterium]
MKKKTVRSLLGIAVSALLLLYVIRDVSIDQLAVSLVQANYYYIIPALPLTLVFYWLRAVRWHYLLKPIKPVPHSQLFSITIIGFMVNNVLPVRIGELVRAYLLGTRENLSKSLSLATIVIERILDGLAILSFLVPIILFFSFPLWLERVGIILLASYAVLIGFLVFLNSYRTSVVMVLQRIVSPLSLTMSHRIGMIVHSFCEGLKLFQSPSQLFWVFFYSYSIWIIAAGVIMLFLYSFHFSFPVHAPFLLLVIMALGAAIPSSPGFVGTLQFFCVTGLAFFGIPRSESLGFSIVYHACQYIPVTLLGFFFLSRSRLRLKEITNEGGDFGENPNRAIKRPGMSPALKRRREF